MYHGGAAMDHYAVTPYGDFRRIGWEKMTLNTARAASYS
jgi:hypothetical protein